MALRDRREDRQMGTLTQTEAKEFGRALRFIRDARRMPLREVSQATEISGAEHHGTLK